MPEARQAQLSELSAQLSALGFQVSPIAPSGSQAFYGARPSNNNRSNNNNRGNRNNSHETGANSHVTLDLEAMDNSEAYYGDDAFHVGNEISHNLLSVQKFCHDNDVFFEFHTSYFVVKDESTHTTLFTGPSKHGLYTITLPQLKSINKVSFSTVRASPTIWHRRLGHPHERLLHSMLSNVSLHNVQTDWGGDAEFVKTSQEALQSPRQSI
ncbi:putative RNA-directed DNA polymerase [Tanacetum coccineum]